MPNTTTAPLSVGPPAQVMARRDDGFLDDMAVLLPWSQLVAEVHAHVAPRAWPCWPHAVSTMLRICFVQRWFGYSDESMADALFCSASYRDFAGLGRLNRPLPEAQAIHDVRTLLDQQALAMALLRGVQWARSDDVRVMAASSASDAALVVWFVSQETQPAVQPGLVQGVVAINA